MDRGAWWATVHGVAGVGHNLATKERERIFICLFLASLGLHGSLWAFSSRGEQGLLSSEGVQASHCSGLPCCRARAPGRVGFSTCSMWAQQLWCMGLGASLHVGASPVQGLNPKFLSLLHWKADSLPPSHQILAGGLPGVRPSRSFSLRGGMICEVPPALVLPPFSPSSLEEPSSTPDLGR